MNERIELLIKLKNITPAQFADELDLQRANVSHILTGRNKPSLDFIQRIIRRYPEVNIPWLLFGEGEILSASLNENDKQEDKTRKEQPNPAKGMSQHFDMRLFPDEDTTPVQESNPEGERNEKGKTETVDIQQNIEENSLTKPVEKTKADKSVEKVSETTGPVSSHPSEIAKDKAEPYIEKEQKRVVKIVFFYADRTFEEYLPEYKVTK